MPELQNMIMNSHTIIYPMPQGQTDWSATGGMNNSMSSDVPMMFVHPHEMFMGFGSTPSTVAPQINRYSHTQFVNGVPVAHPCQSGMDCGCGGSCGEKKFGDSTLNVNGYLPETDFNGTSNNSELLQNGSMMNNSLPLENIDNPHCPSDIPPLTNDPTWSMWHPIAGSTPDDRMIIKFKVPGTDCQLQANCCWRIITTSPAGVIPVIQKLQIFIKKISLVGGGLVRCEDINDPCCNIGDPRFGASIGAPWDSQWTYLVWQGLEQVLQFKDSNDFTIWFKQISEFIKGCPLTKDVELFYHTRCQGSATIGRSSARQEINFPCSSSIASYCKLSCKVCRDTETGAIRVSKRVYQLVGQASDCKPLVKLSPLLNPQNVSCQAIPCNGIISSGKEPVKDLTDHGR
ncbi:MAG: hypothetical protein WCH46_06520 [bacterium]